MNEGALWRHFERHHAVISRSEALGFGVSSGQIAWRAKAGQWVRVAPGVYRLSGAPLTWLGRARAEALSADGLISHRAAAVLHKVDGYRPGTVEVVAERGRKRSRESVILHESTQMHLADVTERQGVPCTGPARTVLDLAAVVGFRRLEWTLDAVLRQGLVEWADLYEVLIRHSRKGRDGCGRLRALLDDRFGSAVADSNWNRRMARLLLDAGLPTPVLEHVVTHRGRFVGRVDIAYPQWRLAIECDSARYHLNRESFERDPRRKNNLAVAGWMVLTFTWADYRDEPWEVVARVRDALAQLQPVGS